jgi:2-alkyl-3-oxoalkanoate reductase
LRVLIAGATGVLGRRLVHLLTERDHDVVGLTRDERGDEVVKSGGGKPLRASLFEPDEIVAAAEELDTIIHAATAIPKKQRTGASDWALNDHIRVHGVESLAKVARRTGAGHLIFQSVVWVARPRDESPFDETAPVNSDAVTESAATAERIALSSGQEYGFTATILRGGWFYAPDAWHTQWFADALRKRMMPIVGSGDAYWSITHVDDAASAYIEAIEQRPQGIYHVVDDEPVQVRDFLTFFAGRLGAKRPFRVPVLLARLTAGSFAVDFVTTSTITNASRLKSATGWKPAYPHYQSGLDQIVSTWEQERR